MAVSAVTRDWHHHCQAHRICRASARLMRLVCRLRDEKGLSEHELLMAVQGLQSALETRKHEGHRHLGREAPRQVEQLPDPEVWIEPLEHG